MKKLRALWVGALVICLTWVTVNVTQRILKSSPPKLNSGGVLSKERVAEALRSSASVNSFPDELDLEVGRQKKRVRIQYSFENKLQKVMEDLIHSYGPDYGAFVALDPRTGRVLSLVSYSRQGLQDNFALRATFPSASVFKVVTAAAAIGEGKASPETVIPYNGRNHTLYRGQVMQSKITPWTRFITLKEAFAHSINTVFGKIGAFSVGPEELRQYAGRFGFNRRIAADMPMQEGRAWIPNDIWGLAESASGFTRDNTMSPLQGALIAASVANQGIMMEPFLVQSMHGADGALLYSAQPRVASIAMDAETAAGIKELMKETVLHGTSRGSFRGFFKKGLSLLDVGGKTGSLTGTDPQGKYDWFVGYADSGPTRIAVAALTISEKKWRVRSSYLARRAIESYFKENLNSRTVAAQ